MRRALVLLLLGSLASAESAQELLRLADGRVLSGRSLERKAGGVLLQTDFGSLFVPADRIAPAGERGETPRAAPPERCVLRTGWLEIECDLEQQRARLYADQLDAFFEWMLVVYELDPDRVRRHAPFRVHVYRRRADFKRVQAEIAPSIERKGKAFAEGVAGFFSGGDWSIHLWDAEGGHRGVHLGVAKHETTHLLNKLLAEQGSYRVPTWFEEGAATYFQMFLPAGDPRGQEPDDHPGALAQVAGDIERGEAYRCRDLRGVGWEDFLGREYSWGWALVRFFRRHARGRRWPALLDHLRTISPSGRVTDSEERRFLKAARFRDAKAFDEAWHRHLAAAAGERGAGPLGTSPDAVARIDGLERPDPKTARFLARVGISLAQARESRAAVAYLRAALRGGIEEADVEYHLALALAEREGLGPGDRWPEDSIAALRRAVALEPLSAFFRHALGRQMEGREARDQIGLALVLAGSNDDDLAMAMDLVRAAATAEPDRPASQVAEGLAESVPGRAAALRSALLYLLQERGEWEGLAALLERRVREEWSDAEALRMLAGLYKASDRLEEAAELYRRLLAMHPVPHQLWPDLVECLAGAGKLTEARAARERARAALEADPPGADRIRRRLDLLDLD